MNHDLDAGLLEHRPVCGAQHSGPSAYSKAIMMRAEIAIYC